jgi:hypothetical protein
MPAYLSVAGPSGAPFSDFENRLRRMTMLDALRRAAVREILVMSERGEPVPSDLKDLWSSGFRCQITFVSEAADAHESLHQFEVSAHQSWH